MVIDWPALFAVALDGLLLLAGLSAALGIAAIAAFAMEVDE